MRPLAVSLAIVFSLAGTQILTAPSAFAHASPGGNKDPRGHSQGAVLEGQL